MIQLQNIKKYYRGQPVLSDVTFRINNREKIGLIGVNGCGKTTLLSIIAGKIAPDGGRAVFERYCPVAVLSQEVTVREGNTLYQEMKSALPDLERIEKSMRETEESMSGAGNDEHKLKELVEFYSELQQKFEQLSGNDLSWKIDKVIQGLGFSLKDRDRSVTHFSGGWQMRVELAKLLLQEMDLLLLDEPTNHLDMKAVEWLEEYLSSYPGAVVIVSHDRYFLNRVTTRTIHLNRGIAQVYNGNYDFFISSRLKNQEIQAKAFLEQKKKLEKDQRFIERFRYKATLATRVKSREKMLDRMELAEAPEKNQKTIKVRFGFDNRDMTTVFDIKDLIMEYPGKSVSLTGKVEIKHGDRLAVMGENGCGKTTLLKILCGLLRHTSGSVKVHPNARIQCYMQNQTEYLNMNNTAIEEIRNLRPDMTETAVRTLLGCFLFRGDDVFKKVSVLSGGEKSRLALAELVCSTSNVLLFDEPTNHLDIESREVLAEALNDYKGTVIVVSHDRYFLQQVSGKFLEISDGNLRCYHGDYQYYRYCKENEKTRQASEIDDEKERVKKPAPVRKPAAKQNNLLLVKKRILQLEDQVVMLEEELKNLEEQMESPENMSDPDSLLRLSRNYEARQKELKEVMDTWEEMHRELMSA